jgi:hypothetical protein
LVETKQQSLDTGEHGKSRNSKITGRSFKQAQVTATDVASSEEVSDPEGSRYVRVAAMKCPK